MHLPRLHFDAAGRKGRPNDTERGFSVPRRHRKIDPSLDENVLNALDGKQHILSKPWLQLAAVKISNAYPRQAPKVTTRLYRKGSRVCANTAGLAAAWLIIRMAARGCTWHPKRHNIPKYTLPLDALQAGIVYVSQASKPQRMRLMAMGNTLQ